MLDLSGSWQILPVETFRDSYDASMPWIEQVLPAHWQEHPELAEHTGRVVYRKVFTLEEAAFQAPGRVELRVRGIFYRFRIHLNGALIANSEGYFFPHHFDVTRHLAETNELIIEVESPQERSCLEKETITGVFAHWDALSSYRYNPGGVWLPVELIRLGPLHVREALFRLDTFDDTCAFIAARLNLAIETPQSAKWTITVSPHNFLGAPQIFEGTIELPEGLYGWHHNLTLSPYKLWWSHDMGFPALYRIHVMLEGQTGARTEWEGISGLRTWEMRDYIAYLNGKRLYIKGSNYPPSDARLAGLTAQRAHQDLELAKSAHMNMLRVHAHVDHPALYAAADEAGVLLWQDFPLQWLYAKKILPEAVRQSQEMVRLLHNHPSIVIWCLHNEPLHVDDTSVEPLLRQLRTYWSLIRSWNRDVMGSELVRSVKKLDESRTVIRSSGEIWIPGWLDGTDGHFYFGWYMSYGPKRWFDLWARLFKRNLRFVTEFGAQSFPNYENARTFLPDDLRGSNWRYLNEQFLLQWELMSLWIDTRSHDLQDLVQKSQAYQSEIHRYYTDRLRYYKYRPNGGFLNFMFTDSQPGVSWSLVDYWRQPKTSYKAYQEALAPLYAFCLTPKDYYQRKKRYQLPIYVVNDHHHPVSFTVTIRLQRPNGQIDVEQTHHLTLPADSEAQSLGFIRFKPDEAGTWQLNVSWHAEQGPSQKNCYALSVETNRTS